MTEDHLDEAYGETIGPFWDKQTHPITFRSNVDGLELRGVACLQPSRETAIIVSSGRTESFVKYKELVYDLYARGYSVFIADHRGQGLSGRLLAGEAKRQMGHVRDFKDYVNDLKQFYTGIVRPTGHRSHVLLGHSMGGCIGALHLEAYPQDFDAAVLSSPMFELVLNLPNGLTEETFDWNALSGHEEEYAPNSHGYDEDAAFPGNNLTHSEVRWNLMRREYERHPDAKLGGPSVLWVKLALGAARAARENAGAVEVPVLLLQAGADTIVKPAGQLEFCQGLNQRHPRFCRLERIEGAFHELFMESDLYREQALASTLDFVRTQLR